MNPETKVPDGGRGWAVVFGTALINVFNQSLLSLFGLVFGAKLQSMAGTTGVTTVMSVNCAISNLSGFVIGPISKILSEKHITQIGVVFVSVGLAVCAYTSSYSQIMIGYGVLSGLGLGLIASCTFLLINSYFSKNKSLAVGFSMAGTSIGQMALPSIVALLVDYYGYSGTVLILSGLSLNGLIGAMVFKPVSKYTSPRNRKETKDSPTTCWDGICCPRNKDSVVIENKHALEMDKQFDLINETNLDIPKIESTNLTINNNDNNDDSKKLVLSSNNKDVINDVDESPNKNKQIDVEKQGDGKTEEEAMLPNNEPGFELTIAEEKKEKKTNLCIKIVDLLNLKLLKDMNFVHIMVGLSLAYTTSITFSTLFPLFLTVDLKMSMMEASTCMAALSLMDFVGRVIVPLTTKNLKISHRIVFILGSFVLAISRSMLVIQRTYTMVMLLSSICGLARAATVINQNLVIAEYSKEAHVSYAVGLNMVSKGLFVLTIGRLLGMYKDSAHNYSGCIQVLNLISLAVVASWTTELVIKRLKTKST